MSALAAVLILDSAALLLGVGLLLVVLRARTAAERIPLAVLLVGIAVWTLGDLVAQFPIGLRATLASVGVQLVASAAAVLGLFVLVLEYTGRGHLVTRRSVAALAVEPVLLAVLIATNSIHGLVFVRSIPGGDYADYAHMGPAYAGHAIYSYTFIAVCVVLLVETAYRADVHYRRQAYTLLAGIVVPFVGNVVYLFGPVDVDLTPILFTVTAAVFTYAVVRTDLLHLSPVAHDVVMDAINDGVVVLNRQGRIVDANPRANALVAPESDSIVGRPIDATVESSALATRVQEILPSEEVRQFEVDHGDRTLHAQVTPLCDGRDRRVGDVLVVGDVTTRKRHERELERQNERLDRFVGTVSHDLRNPLQVATGYLSLLETNQRAAADAEAVAKIDESLDRMARIIDELLRSTREADPVEKQRVDLVQLVPECWEGVATGTAEIRVEGDLTIEADPDGLRRLLENLFRNAVEHAVPRASGEIGNAVEQGSTRNRSPANSDDTVGHAGTDVTVTVGPLGGPGEIGGPRGFFVEDDGRGIPTDDRERIFEWGVSTDGGSGLGLASVEQVAVAHGWEITVTDGRDGGARFEVSGVGPAPESRTGGD